MNPKLRPLYLLLGAAGLFALVFQVLYNLPQIDLVMILAIAIPDMFFFYLAYLTYPPDPAPRSWEYYES
jgi:hypothetical protein